MEKELDYKQFVDDFEEWVKEQVAVFQMAEKVAEEALDKDPEDMNAASAMVTYHSRVDAYQFLALKFENFRKGKSFHELPDGLFQERKH